MTEQIKTGVNTKSNRSISESNLSEVAAKIS